MKTKITTVEANTPEEIAIKTEQMLEKVNGFASTIIKNGEKWVCFIYYKTYLKD
jgi:chorismate mutase